MRIKPQTCCTAGLPVFLNTCGTNTITGRKKCRIINLCQPDTILLTISCNTFGIYVLHEIFLHLLNRLESNICLMQNTIQPYLCSCDYAYMHRHIAGNEKDTNYKETGIRDYRLYHARPGRRGLFCKRNADYTAVLSVVKRSGASSAESDLSAAYLTSDPSLHIILLLCCVSSGESICYEQTNAASIRCVLLCGNSGNLAVRIHWYGAGHSRYL